MICLKTCCSFPFLLIKDCIPFLSELGIQEIFLLLGLLTKLFISLHKSAMSHYKYLITKVTHEQM